MSRIKIEEPIGYIYKIQNLINNKIYIGQTKQKPEKRWRKHIVSYNLGLKFPIYLAFKKYGLENFSFEVIELLPISKLNEREKYWIEYYDSYKNGYNATFGGEGVNRIDYKKIIEIYQKTENLTLTAEILKISRDTVRHALQVNNISIPKGKRVNQYDLQNNYIQSFDSISEAAKKINPNNISSAITGISNVCRGNKKSSYGYIWKYSLIEEQ